MYTIYVCSVLILFMYFISGFSKLLAIDKKAIGLEKRFPIKNLPFNFFRLSICIVILLQIVGPIVIMYSIRYMKKIVVKIYMIKGMMNG